MAEVTKDLIYAAALDIDARLTRLEYEMQATLVELRALRRATEAVSAQFVSMRTAIDPLRPVPAA